MQAILSNEEDRRGRAEASSSVTPSFEEAPMRYLILVCVDPEAERYVPEENNVEEWTDETDRRNVRILGHGLKSVADAITVRRRKGQVLITDGPFTETKE
jgi:hypothetical protein